MITLYLKEIKNKIVKFVIFPCNNISAHGTDHDNQKHNTNCYNSAVFHRIEIVFQGKGILEILKIKRCGKCQLGFCKFRFGLKCITNRHIKGSQTDQGKEPQDCNTDCCLNFIFFCMYHNSISLLLSILVITLERIMQKIR